MSEPAHDVTRLLDRMRAGDADAAERLLPLVYAELRSVAERLFRSQPDDHTLQPTALVHEAYLKMAGQTGFNDRAHFLGVAAIAMRQVLVNHARDKGAVKRGGGKGRRLVTVSEVPAAGIELDVLAVHEALETLSGLDERQAKITELRLFGGLTLDETATAIGVSRRTVAAEWKMARSWLGRRLGLGNEPAD